jgi:hypothetical protein
VATAILDDDGIDLIFSRKGHPETLSVQVKSRFLDSDQVQNGTFSTPIREATFAPAPDVYLLGIIVDVPTTSITHAWFIPSDVINERCKPNGQNTRVVTASIKPGTKNQWVPFRVAPDQIGARIGDLLTVCNPERARSTWGCCPAAGCPTERAESGIASTVKERELDFVSGNVATHSCGGLLSPVAHQSAVVGVGAWKPRGGGGIGPNTKGAKLLGDDLVEDDASR